MDPAKESITGYDFGTKTFYSKSTNTLYQPYIEYLYNDHIKDDRSAGVVRGASASLAFYNVVNGSFQDITVDGYGTNTGNFLGHVTLYGSTKATGPWQALTGHTTDGRLAATRIRKGIYKTSFTLGAGEWSELGSTYGGGQYGENLYNDTEINEYKYFSDRWTLTSNHPLTALSTSSISSTWSATDMFANAGFNDSDTLLVSIKNLRDEYHHDAHARFRLFIEEKGTEFTPLTAALDNIQTGIIVKNGFVKIVDHITNETVIPYTVLDYDKDGNFFEVDMSNLECRKHKIVLKFTHKGEVKILDKNLFTFTVI